MSSPYTAFQVPLQPQGNAGNYSSPYSGFQGAQQSPQPPQIQGGALMRFIKAAGGKLLGGTLNAGPTMQSGGDEEKLKYLQEIEARAQSGAPINENLSPSISAMGTNTLSELKQLNPISIEKFKQGDIAGGAGDTLANLLLLRGALKTKGLPEFGRSGAAEMAESVQPLNGYTNGIKPPSVWNGQMPQGYEHLPVSTAPISATPIQDALLRPDNLAAGKTVNPRPATPDNLIQPGTEGTRNFEQPRKLITVEDRAGQGDPISQSMLRYRATAKARASIPSSDVQAQMDATKINSPDQASAALEQAARNLFGKSYDELTVSQRLQTLSEGAKIQNSLSPTPIQDAISGKTASRHVGPGPAQFRRWLAQKAAQQGNK